MGLEDTDEFLRNTVYAKDLTLLNFERAIQMAERYGLDPGVFIFAGAFILTPGEALDAVRTTLGYCQRHGLFANVMLPNVQPYTVPAVLFQSDRYALPEPFFLLDIADVLLQYRPKRETKDVPFFWFIGGLVAYPRPLATILSNPKRRTSGETTRRIHDAVKQLIQMQNCDRFRRIADSLRSGPEYGHYVKMLHVDDALPWTARLRSAIDFAQNASEVYNTRGK